jgi:mannose-6-phosphate isomerase-like protein (cupin superfamily)
MRTIIGVIAGLLIASSVAAQAPLGATDITAAEVQAFLKASPRDRNTDRPIRVVDVGGYRIGVFGVFRPREAVVASTVHQTKVTEVYYILEGAGTLVTGGEQRTTVKPRESTLGEWTDLVSSGTDGGVARRASKGDVIIIPGGVPHSWSSLEGDITYLIIRADPNNQVPLK